MPCPCHRQGWVKSFCRHLSFQKKGMKDAYIIDPTIRYENYKEDQVVLVDQEKKDVSESYIPFYKDRYYDKFGAHNFIVYGLLFGARGTVYRHTIEILKCFSVEKIDFYYISESIIADSVGIIHHHIYNN